MKKLLLLILCSLTLSFAFAQPVCSTRISLLTCAPGEELYSTFGHTAIRVQDSTTGTDLIYNYGTFEFGPDFYMQFIRGKLLYFLSVENFPDFMYQYQMESRSVVEQVLNLDCVEKQKLVTALQTNAMVEHRYYKYDFLFDNCTTRAKEIIKANTTSPVSLSNILPAKHPTFRDQIHSYLDAGHQYWSKLGIDLLLGAKLDTKVTNEQAMFLPDYLLNGFDHASTGGKPLVGEKKTILQMPSPLGKASIWTPTVIFSLLLLVVIVISLFGSQPLKRVVPFIDFLVFFFAGITGIIILFMWTGTDHIVCRNNYNLLWALPTHLLAAFFVFRKPQWLRNYFTVVFWLSCLTLICWSFLPQQLNISLIPIVLLIAFRSFYIAKPVTTWKKRPSY